MTLLLGAVAVFLSFVMTVWLGDLGVYLPLSVWMVFAIGNFFGIRAGIWMALLAATLSGLTYDRGAAGFLEPFTALIFWIPAVIKGRRYVFGTASSWLPGFCIGLAAPLLLYSAWLLQGNWRYTEAWLSFAANTAFCGMVGILFQPVMIGMIGAVSRKLGFDLPRAGEHK